MADITGSRKATSSRKTQIVESRPLDHKLQNYTWWSSHWTCGNIPLEELTSQNLAEAKAGKTSCDETSVMFCCVHNSSDKTLTENHMKGEN